jgi:hypothetical protein
MSARCPEADNVRGKRREHHDACQPLSSKQIISSTVEKDVQPNPERGKSLIESGSRIGIDGSRRNTRRGGNEDVGAIRNPR